MIELIILFVFIVFNFITFVIRIPLLKFLVALFSILIALTVNTDFFYINLFLILLSIINIYDAAVKLRG